MTKAFSVPQHSLDWSMRRRRETTWSSPAPARRP
jgi:hypothetical protein